MARRSALPVLVLVILLAAALPAHATIVEPPAPEGRAQLASPAGPALRSPAHAASAAPRLWATVNVCDTFEWPDAMGVRASMPGNGTRQRMYMRFSAQWWSGLRQQWLDVPGASSPWVYAGSARYRARQAGWSFDFETPSMGSAYVVRGSVRYQWRSRRRGKRAGRSRYRIARELSLVTRSGVRGVHGGDPRGTSKAMCMVANLP